MATTPRPREDVIEAEIVIVGGGPVGLTLALDLARRGRPVVVLNRLDHVAGGSKAICFAKRSLEIFDRLGVGNAIADRGVTWNVSKIFWRDDPRPIDTIDMLPIKDQKHPAFINIQQYHVESTLIDALEQQSLADVRWGHRVIDVEAYNDSARLTVEAPGGAYDIFAQWVIACDGHRSSVRDMLGLDFAGRAFEDHFLIADIRMAAERPAERWFWFDPPFNPGRSALLHKQPDNIWRVDFQLGREVDRKACIRPENVELYVRAMLGHDVEFQPVWYSAYTFQCRRMARFVHGRIVFTGDAAHLVSPFGARGCNGGIAAAYNLGWKLERVLIKQAPVDLIESYNDEATHAADENIRASTRSTNFMVPTSKTNQALRNAVLELAVDHPFARSFINSGRLSTAITYSASPLITPDIEDWMGAGVPPGAPALDAPLGGGWLLDQLGKGFVLLANDWPDSPPPGIQLLDIRASSCTARLRQRYALRPRSAYLIRPDQYVTARWQNANNVSVAAALGRAHAGGDIRTSRSDNGTP